MRTIKTERAGAVAPAPGPNVVKAAGLTIPRSVMICDGQSIPALIALHIGVPYLASREGDAR